MVFDTIKDWKKIVEGRAGWKVYNLKPWEKIGFSFEDQKIEKTFVSIKYYQEKNEIETIKKYLETQWLENCLPHIKSVEQWIKLYLSFPWYKEKIRNFGIYAIRFE